MSLLFVHDHKFMRLGCNYFSNGAFPSSVWKRYLSVFGELTVVGRDGGELAEIDKGATISSVENVRFCLLSNVSNLTSLIVGNRSTSKAIPLLVSQHSAVIARLPSRLGSLFIKEAIKQNKPYAVEVVGCPWDALWNYGSVKGKLYAPYATLELKKILQKTEYVLYVTKDFLQKRYPPSKRAVTAFCSNVEIEPVGDEVVHNRLKRVRRAKPEGAFTFGIIANYSSSYKGIDIAIKALACTNLSSWKLMVLGKGDPSPYVALAKSLGVLERVEFVGSLPSGAPVHRWLDSIDIYLQPSLTEGMPRALIEAMSRGCPALASNVGGIPELLSSTEMSSAADVKGLANNIVRLVGDATERESLAMKNFAVAKDYYADVLDARRAEFWATFKRDILREHGSC